MRLHLLLGCTIACTPTSAPKDTTAGGDDPDSPSPWTETEGPYLGEAPEEDPPGFDPDGAPAAIQQALDLARGLHAQPVHEGYLAMLDLADEGCPLWYQDDEVPYWYDSCQTEGGAHFEGYAYHFDYVDYIDGDTVQNGWAFYGFATILAPDGTVFQASGEAGITEGITDEGQQIFYTYLSEGLFYDGPSAAGTWLETGAASSINWYAAQLPVDVPDNPPGRAVQLNGRVVLGEGELQAVVFEDLVMANAEYGATCTAEPSGAVSLLDSQGHWTDLIFDAPLLGSGQPAGEGCDGCAAAWYRGTYLGEACVDFGPLLDWEETPFD